jgi:hypothetical protein
VAPAGVCQGPRALTQRSPGSGRPHGRAASTPQDASAGGPPPGDPPSTSLPSGAWSPLARVRDRYSPTRDTIAANSDSFRPPPIYRWPSYIGGPPPAKHLAATGRLVAASSSPSCSTSVGWIPTSNQKSRPVTSASLGQRLRTPCCSLAQNLTGTDTHISKPTFRVESESVGLRDLNRQSSREKATFVSGHAKSGPKRLSFGGP